MRTFLAFIGAALWICAVAVFGATAGPAIFFAIASQFGADPPAARAALAAMAIGCAAGAAAAIIHLRARGRAARRCRIICPNVNCGYEGPARRRARGSAIVGVVLLCLMVLPGVLYLIFAQGYRYYCPNCGIQVGSDA